MEQYQGVVKLVNEIENIPDPRRQNGNLRHPFVSLIVSAILAVLAGCDSWEDISRYVTFNFEWFKDIIPFPNGAPSPDTYSRIFSLINADAFEKVFISWVNSMKDQINKEEYKIEHIALDGKTIRRSHSLNKGLKPLHVVSAYSTSTGLVLAQRTVDEKSNEITAIPEVLDLIDLENTVTTIDAIGCQKKIADKIIQKGGDYLLAVKGNQDFTYNLIQEYFDVKQISCLRKYTTISTNQNHGRDEERNYYVSEELNSNIILQTKWSHLKSVIMVEANRLINGSLSTEKRYYLSSLPASEIETIGNSIRSHWGVENSVHWVLDMVFREDECRKRERNSAMAFSLLRKFALNALNIYQQKMPKKRSIRLLRKECGWAPSFLLEVIGI